MKTIDEKVVRINELYKKAKEVGLTCEETAEQAQLRQDYVNAFKQSLTAQLDNTYIVDEKGNKTKVGPKK